MPVVAVGSHDTASAVVGVPMQTDDAAYVSLGTWALAGLELDAPVLTEEARAASLTNEGGVDGTVRFLSNVMGTWLLSETLRTWGETDLAGMLRAAEAYDGPVPIVDVQDPRFLPPGRHGGPDRGVVRRARRRSSRAVGWRWCGASSRASRPPSRPRSSGRATLAGPAASASCTSSAAAARTPCSARRSPTASGLPVLAGPVEATALGNVLVQARTAGVVGPGLADLRALVARTHDLTRFAPRA